MSSPGQPLRLPHQTLRFDDAGIAQTFRGNTILVRVPEGSGLSHTLQLMVSQLSAQISKSRVVWLPQSSWHITITGGVCDVFRDTNRWPAGKSSQLLDQCTKDFSNLLLSDKANLGKEGLGPPYHMQIKGVKRFGAAIGVIFEGTTDEEEVRLRALKNRIADILGFRHPNHGEYSWHVSLAYYLDEGSDQEAKDVLSAVQHDFAASPEIYPFGAPEFCAFEDMVSFKTLHNVSSA